MLRENGAPRKRIKREISAYHQQEDDYDDDEEMTDDNMTCMLISLYCYLL